MMILTVTQQKSLARNCLKLVTHLSILLYVTVKMHHFGLTKFSVLDMSRDL